jgi:hypothetical protein
MKRKVAEGRDELLSYILAILYPSSTTSDEDRDWKPADIRYVTKADNGRWTTRHKNEFDSPYSITGMSDGDLNPYDFLATMKASAVGWPLPPSVPIEICVYGDPGRICWGLGWIALRHWEERMATQRLRSGRRRASTRLRGGGSMRRWRGRHGVRDKEGYLGGRCGIK